MKDMAYLKVQKKKNTRAFLNWRKGHCSWRRKSERKVINVNPGVRHETMCMAI